MSDITFSIVITIYNIEDYIGECIESIRAQNDIDFEIICVDDCSTDKSWDVLKSYAKYDERIKLFKTEKNSGLASARNIGLRASIGEYIYNIDGDDLLAENALETMYQYMSKYELDMLSFSALSFFDDDSLHKFGTEDEYIRKNEYPGVWEGKKLFAELVKNDERVNGNMVLYCFRNSFIKDNNLYLTEGLRYGDDRMFSIFMRAHRAMCINLPLYKRRYRVGSAVTGEKKRVYLESLVVGLGSDLNTWMTSVNDCEVNRQIERYFDGRIREIDRLDKLFLNDTSEMKYLSMFPAEKYMYELFFKKRTINDELLDSDTLEMIKNARRVYIYGMGDIADRVTEVLEFHGIDDFEYVVTKANERIHFNRKVYSIDEMNTDMNPFFIIATSSRYSDEIKFVLEEKGFHDYCGISKEI